MFDRSRPFRPSLAFVLLIIVLIVAWLAGGSSRADAGGQSVIRGVAWMALIVAALGGVQPAFGRERAVATMLGAAVALAVLQLVPLPPELWRALPGRASLEPAAVYGAAAGWRPLSLVPSATLNAASSLVVPVVVLTLITDLRQQERDQLPLLALTLIVFAMLFGLIQVSSAGLVNPLAGWRQNEVGGPFANRNHFALLLAMGCAIAPAWAVADEREVRWRGPLCIGLVPLFELMILATGSRAGLLLGVLALVAGLALARHGIRRRLQHISRGRIIAISVAVIVLLVMVVLLSVATDRAASIDRAIDIDTAQDMRRRGLPTVLAMVVAYFPVGSGLGGFDPLFRLHEPDALLTSTYFNHAHNDFLEVVLDAGLPGLLMLITSVAWWGWASVRAWRAPRDQLMPRLGSALLLLVIVASAFDYPARTPLVMAMVVIAAVWLSSASRKGVV